MRYSTVGKALKSSLTKKNGSFHSEERIIRGGELDVRLVINRPHQRMRFMDYRVGNYEEKRDLLDRIARQERLRKIFTVVEKQDSNCWKSIGFCREGVYPSFFRTADAYVMSRFYDALGAPISSTPLKPSSNEKTHFPARKLRKPGGFSLTSIDDEPSRSDLLTRLNGDLQVLPFARVKPPDVVLHARDRRRQGWAVAEIDDSFGHATVSFAPQPSGDPELVLSAYAGNGLVNELAARRITNVFGVSAMADRWTNELFSGLGFRITGRLAGHLRRADGGYANALLWHRRLDTGA